MGLEKYRNIWLRFRSSSWSFFKDTAQSFLFLLASLFPMQNQGWSHREKKQSFLSSHSFVFSVWKQKGHIQSFFQSSFPQVLSFNLFHSCTFMEKERKAFVELFWYHFYCWIFLKISLLCHNGTIFKHFFQNGSFKHWSKSNLPWVSCQNFYQTTKDQEKGGMEIPKDDRGLKKRGWSLCKTHRSLHQPTDTHTPMLFTDIKLSSSTLQGVLPKPA